jgi:hypothetical protein
MAFGERPAAGANAASGFLVAPGRAIDEPRG